VLDKGRGGPAYSLASEVEGEESYNTTIPLPAHQFKRRFYGRLTCLGRSRFLVERSHVDYR